MIWKWAGAVAMSFANTYSLYKTVKSVSYVRSIGRHDEQNIFEI
jgi:hypothetical protein